MARKYPVVNVTLGPDAFRAIEARSTGPEANRSSTVSAMISRYARICERCRPDLTEPEWNLIRDALNGCWLTDHPCSWASVEIADHVRLNQADQKWKVDWPKTKAKIETFTEGEWTAIVDAVEIWWRTTERQVIT